MTILLVELGVFAATLVVAFAAVGVWAWFAPGGRDGGSNDAELSC